MNTERTTAVVAYTDGACEGNPGPGGFGVVYVADEGEPVELYGAHGDTTNNQMELLAAIAVLERLPAGATVELHTDSRYVQDGITQWLPNWKRRNWRLKSGGAVKNVELWKRLDRAAARHRVRWLWVKGHAGHDGNERADDLARLAIQHWREGRLPESDLTERADTPAGMPVADVARRKKKAKAGAATANASAKASAATNSPAAQSASAESADASAVPNANAHDAAPAPASQETPAGPSPSSATRPNAGPANAATVPPLRRDLFADSTPLAATSASAGGPPPSTRRLVLASTSPFRRDQLARLGLPFEAHAPGVDEAPIKAAGAGPVEIVRTLARQKAEALAGRFPGALLLGADQTALYGGTPLDKPGTPERAVEQLLTLAGRTHQLLTAVAIHDTATGTTHEHLDVHEMTMRPLSREQARAYVERDRTWDCAGAYKYESFGIALFRRVYGEDATAIVGLPLLWVCETLAALGLDPLAVPASRPAK